MSEPTDKSPADAAPEGAQEFLVSPYDIPDEYVIPLKGQLHCHWYDDGRTVRLLGVEVPIPGPSLTRNPDSIAKDYHDLGYHFLAFTEHNEQVVLDYITQNHDCGAQLGTCLVPATPEVNAPPLFIEILRSEEVTAETHHVLGFGVRKEVTHVACQDDPLFAPLAEAVRQKDEQGNRVGVALLPHPRQYLGDAAYTDFHKQITLAESAETLFSAISVRTAASALLHKDSLCLWDVLLNQGICTKTAAGRAILLPAYSEDDYAPVGFAGVEILRLGSTWIELQIDRREHASWPEPEDVASRTLLTALQSGRWWTYWVNGGHPWPKQRAYPRLTLCVDEGTITVTSDQPLSSLSFITRCGMTQPDLRTDIPAKQPEAFRCQGDELYVRVAAEYEDSGCTLRIYSNPIRVRDPEHLEIGKVAPLTGEEPTVTLAPDLPVLEVGTTIQLHVEGEVIHAPVRIDKRVVAYAKPTMGTEWQAKVDVSSYPSGSYTLQVEVVDRQGRSAVTERQIEVRNGLVPSAIDIDQASLPTSPQTGFAWLRGKIAPVYKGARPAGVVVRVDGRDTQVLKASIKGEAWWCQIAQQVFTRGPHTVEATALYARTSQKVEAKFTIG